MNFHQVYCSLTRNIRLDLVKRCARHGAQSSWLKLNFTLLGPQLLWISSSVLTFGRDAFLSVAFQKRRRDYRAYDVVLKFRE
jgi:hypothetical protein